MSSNSPASSKQTFMASIARGLAAFMGGFTLLNLLGELRSPGFDANCWWIDLRLIPSPWNELILLIASACMVALAIKPVQQGLRRSITMVVLVVLLGVALINAGGFYRAMAIGKISAAPPLPLSLVIALTLFAIFWLTWRYPEQSAKSGRQTIVTGVTFAACLVIFPLLQMYCFGKTDYRRQADAIVVFGARAYANGTCSDALADRVRTACQLYRDGLAPVLIFSGGPGDGAVDEPQAMRELANAIGVPDSAIIMDHVGVNTDATANNTIRIFRERNIKRVITVSHFYHLPRVKMAYQRDGYAVFTVPARETYILSKMPYLMAREVAALWVYYLRAVIA